jgi:diguanylate cyclase (GGDEF)-like protein
MKTVVIGLLALSMVQVCAGETATSTDVQTLHKLTNAEARKRFPVRFEATVTYYRDYDTDLFVQDGDSAIYVDYRAGAPLLMGDRVVIQGKVQESFRPIVVADDVTVLHHGVLPKPIEVTAKELFSAQRDCLLATIHGTVRSAQMVWSAGRRNLYMQVLIDGGYIDAAVNSDDASAVSRLMDSEVEVTGVVTSEFDQKMQLSGARLDVQSLADVRMLKPASGSLESLPVTPLQDVLSGYHIRDFSERVQVKGTITYYQPRRSVVLQSGAQSLWIVTQTDVPLQLGDVAYASGFPNVRNGYVTLDHAEVRDTHVAQAIAPQPLAYNQIGFGQYAFNLVSAEGELVMEAREAAQDEYVFTSHGHLFSAIYRHPRGMSESELPPMKEVAAGSRVRVTGINMFFNSDPFDGPVESNLLLRDFGDITVIAPPSWLSKRNLEITVAVLFVVFLAIAVKGWQLEHKLVRQAGAAAQKNEKEAEIERRRSRILEKINGTGPLGEILNLVTEFVSFRMGGVPCWCETRDGESFGARTSEERNLTGNRQELLSGSGASLGYIFADVSPLAAPDSSRDEALASGASLASLAIETRRLHADLVHRAEFDLLTDAHSRYFLEKELDALTQTASANGGMLGVIYFDLDHFKQVNDSLGHRVGDEYLQQVATRIKSELRAQDKLARLGGDEFAILVPRVNSRSEIQEIIARLQKCLDKPIVVGGHVLRSSASFGMAIYPEDGGTREELLDIADTAMYAAKVGKR